jgi:hypothetical protein
MVWWVLACAKVDPYQLGLTIHGPPGTEDLVSSSNVALLAIDANGVQTLVPVGEGGAERAGVPTIPDTAVELGLLAGGSDWDGTAADYTGLAAWGRAPIDAVPQPGERVDLELFVSPFGDVAQLGPVPPNRRVLAGALALDPQGTVWIAGGQLPGSADTDASDALFRLDLDGGDDAPEPLQVKLPKTTGLVPNDIGGQPDEEREYTGRVNLTATAVQGGRGRQDPVRGRSPGDRLPVRAHVAGAAARHRHRDAREAGDAGGPVEPPRGQVLERRGAAVRRLRGQRVPAPVVHDLDGGQGLQGRVELVGDGGGARGGGPVRRGRGGVRGATSAPPTAPRSSGGRRRRAACASGRTASCGTSTPSPSRCRRWRWRRPRMAGCSRWAGFSEPAIDVLSGGFVDSFGSSPAVASAYRWTAARGWESVGRLKQARAHHAAVALADGSVLVVGGDSFGTAYQGPLVDPLRCPERYDPALDQFTLLEGCSDATLGRVHDGGGVPGRGGGDGGATPSTRRRCRSTAARRWAPRRVGPPPE